MDHHKRAEALLTEAYESAEPEASQCTTLATAHAVLALIDIITGDRETEIQDANQRITELEEQLEGCRNALRQREQAAANAAKTNNDLRKSYE